MDQAIETYIRSIVGDLDCSNQDKEDIVEEMRDHLYTAKADYMNKGLAEDEATKKVLKDFGQVEILHTGYQETVIPHYRSWKVIGWMLFSFYVIVALHKLIIDRIIDLVLIYKVYGEPLNPFVFSDQNSGMLFDYSGWRFNTNFIPFNTIYSYLTSFGEMNTSIILYNLFGNMVIFIPLGLLLPVLIKRFRHAKSIFKLAVVTSIIIEVIQFLFSIGRADVDDVILLTAGAMIGYILFVYIQKWLRGLSRSKHNQKTISA
ncbi:VanZ family protein [Viridibacillus sp. YIM B01967]|uniref:VanZ family protein n=1 Tax=Viridibacillus soli TaxID=2798301 RepID=A0ABS1HAI2_9BACL|nr:VanZ family protein [Viridibacillus soli]MBK3496427.1 VanZ family protein [Viridibacillus soli]